MPVLHLDRQFPTPLAASSPVKRKGAGFVVQLQDATPGDFQLSRAVKRAAGQWRFAEAEQQLALPGVGVDEVTHRYYSIAPCGKHDVSGVFRAERLD